MTAATIVRHDVKITISDLAGIRAKAALPGVTLFELATLRLPDSSGTATATDASAIRCSGCGGGCSPAG